jgi:hypothetical protein
MAASLKSDRKFEEFARRQAVVFPVIFRDPRIFRAISL